FFFSFQGDYVWVDLDVGEDKVPIGAEVKLSSTGELQLIDDEGKEHKITKKLESSLKTMHPSSVNGVDDMIRLGDLNEAGLLRNLLVRHKEGIIYTYTGSILVAVNPYQLLPLYTTEQVHLYTDRRLGELPPHVFAIADSCFFNMRRSRKDQCCIISGESGAGKTESTKLMLQFLAAVSGQHSWIEQQILEANPILEAFGNAKTIRNDNSSRFGKYIDIHFSKSGVIEGARIEQYLLEKSRVCRQAPEERNYHIFYCMLMGMPAEQKKILALGTASEYRYLTMGKCTSCEGRDDIKEYAHFRSAMKILTFTENECWEICKHLAAILHLGNVDFECKDVFRHLLLHGLSLVEQTGCPPNPAFSHLLNDFKTHALVQAIYGKMFVWIVEKINSAIYKPPSEDYKPQSIGLLDIFGFENFNHNSFEQLCINFANEQLQQFFVKHIFKLEQEEYAHEDIVWKHISFSDNKDTLDLLANKDMNILALIDEECHFPKGTDATLLYKMNQKHKDSKVYKPPKSSHDTKFEIKHFAGHVTYDSQGFLEKNRDALSSDLLKLVDTSTNKLLRQIFHNDVSTTTTGITNIIQGGSSLKRVPTLSGQFRQSLDALMTTLTACQPYFIRCIKPNDFKKPMLFDRELCMRQLKYSGMMETIRIRKAGYPIRHSFQEFLERYRVLLNGQSAKACSESICSAVLNGEDWKVGKTKIFLKDYHDTFLELEREAALNVKALIIQRVLRGYKYRRGFLRQKAAALVLQKQWRGYKVRKQFRVVRQGFSRLQATVRSRQLCHRYRRQRAAAIVLQSYARAFVTRREWRRKRAAVILLQSHTRGVLARKSVKRIQNDVWQLREEKQDEELASITDQEMVDNIFGFLPSVVGGQEGQAPDGFEDLEGKRLLLEEVDLDEAPMAVDLPEEDYDDLDEYSFSKFASMYFQGAATPVFIRQRLRQPLLYHEDEGDVLAALTVWWIILRFMGDLPEPKPIMNDKPIAPDRSLQPDVASRQNRRLSNLVGIDQEEVSLMEEVMIGEGPTLDRPLSSLEKLHIIMGYGIVRRDLRDEIYCQICKQLQENGNRNSFFRGWILLSLCLGIFPPTERFIKYLQNFIRTGPGGYAPYCAERLRRTVANGVRGEPASWLELQATKSKKPMGISVTLMDGRTINMPVDSASTSNEICQTIAQKVKLTDTFGFSLYVALYEKVWSLGNGREHVMDAITQCEQEVKRKGGQEQHAPWRLYFRKEIFTPWHDCGQDEVSTDLIYRQVIRGLKYGEYLCEKEDDFIQLAAKHFYIQHGSDASMENAKSVVNECINSTLLEAKSEAKWVQMVSQAHSDVSPKVLKKANKVKAEVVDYARQKWYMLFSKFFEVIKISGPALPKNKFILAINLSGLTFLDERERKLIVETLNPGHSVCLLTLKGDFMLNAVSAADIANLTTMFLDGLRERSEYAVTLQESSKLDDPTYLSFKKSELIQLIKDKEYLPDRGWLKGRNERTGQIGAVPTDAILILPTLTKPSNEILTLISLSPDQRQNIISSTQKGTSTERVAPMSLKEYSFEYFRPPSKDVNKHIMSKGAAPEKLWANSREPLRQPLLKSLMGNSELSHQACQYMGDYPTRQVQTPLELTDQIFGPATQHEALRDEIYCQIMKQMTSNNNRFSMEQGWQLMWLCCGLFPPSNSLLKHAQRFLESRRRETLAPDCLQRLQASLRTEPRKLPPHQVEVDAIQQNSTQIFHKIHFPNDTEEIFEVGTSTRIKDLSHTIADKLMLVSADGFSLFMKTPDKVLGLNETDYFFDSLRQITDWSKKSKRVKEAGPVAVPYLVFFMRKLWFNVSPGRDLEADLIFHFPQELPKYLRGYHRCTKEEVVHLGGLLFRVKVNDDKSQFIMIPKMLKDLVPNDMLKVTSADDWKKNIIAAYNKQAGLTVDEAKVAFLKAVCKWPTFGCAFFEVKQTSEPSYPDIVKLAISKQGVTIINPKTKDILANHPYNKIANWCSGSTYFHMTVGSLVRGNKILCETSLGYKIDDLITSYVNMYLNETKAVARPRNQRFR
uniref:Myosin VIIBb n=1 Tax=Denticeps clupeoides TaxID=299321 RepID=A0AAY4EUY2_9TELE